MSTQIDSPIEQSKEQARDSSRDWTQRIAIIIPTYKAEPHWPNLQRSLDQQGVSPDRVLVIDSSSPDRTESLARTAGYRVVTVPQKDFNHGGTRQLAQKYVPEAEFLLYVTQDVVFATSDSVQHLYRTMDNPRIGAAYGRQLPRDEAGPIERHARLFSYPAISHVRTFADRQTLGIRVAFLSNSFAIYRRSALDAVGGFPLEVIFGEDIYVAVKMLRGGWSIGYAAEAQVIHSHPLTLKEEFHRYFDIGSHHARENWMLEATGRAGGEGLKFVRSELRYLGAHSKRSIPLALLRTGSKLAAYRLGLLSPRLPRTINRQLATNAGSWE